MAKGDISMIGVSGGTRPYRVAASATRGYAGDPINSLGVRTSGAVNVNTVVVLTDGKPLVGTDAFVGIAGENMKVNSAGTVLAHTLSVAIPIPHCTRIRGKAETVANIDTDAELLAILWDATSFGLSSGVYTISETAAGDTEGLMIVDGNITKGTLDVVVDARVMRTDVA